MWILRIRLITSRGRREEAEFFSFLSLCFAIAGGFLFFDVADYAIALPVDSAVEKNLF